MKQIITQHGWGLNKHFWDNYKVDFLNKNWHWQDNERGYFSSYNYQAKWIKSDSKKEIRVTLCHSYGFHLMQKNILNEATHIVLINSFNNFLPVSNKRNFILRSLKRMETKMIKNESKDILKEFIHRSFMPNDINDSFKKIFYKSLENLNKTLLLSDLKQLYINRDLPVFLKKDCKIIFIKSENDLILDNESNNNFLNYLNKTLERKPILIKLAKQGHCLNNLNLYEILLNAFND
jgi:pimeloyl-[acyl-carrier protein] methyl ester esterase